MQKNEAGTELKFTLPEDLAPRSEMTLKTPYGNTVYSFLVNNTSGSDIIANFDAPGTPDYGWGGWGAIRTNNPTPFPGSSSYYIQSTFAKVPANNFEWWTNNRNIAGGNWGKIVVPPGELGASASDYYLKFEINAAVPIKEGTIFLIESLDKIAKNSHRTKQYYPYASGTDNILDTKNQWKTITIPISDFGITRIGDFLTPTGAIGDFHIGIVSGAQGIEQFNATFDNFRLVKIKK